MNIKYRELVRFIIEYVKDKKYISSSGIAANYLKTWNDPAWQSKTITNKDLKPTRRTIGGYLRHFHDLGFLIRHCKNDKGKLNGFIYLVTDTFPKSLEELESQKFTIRTKDRMDIDKYLDIPNDNDDFSFLEIGGDDPHFRELLEATYQ